MKWIAKRDFYRTAELADVDIIDACKGAAKTAPHARHIHKGSIFELGVSKNESELQTTRDPQRTLIAQLRYSGCIGDASDKDVVARVEEDVANEAKAAAAEAERVKRSDTSGIAVVLQELLKKAAAAAPAK